MPRIVLMRNRNAHGPRLIRHRRDRANGVGRICRPSQSLKPHRSDLGIAVEQDDVAPGHHRHGEVDRPRESQILVVADDAHSASGTRTSQDERDLGLSAGIVDEQDVGVRVGMPKEGIHARRHCRRSVVHRHHHRHPCRCAGNAATEALHVHVAGVDIPRVANRGEGVRRVGQRLCFGSSCGHGLGRRRGNSDRMRLIR